MSTTVDQRVVSLKFDNSQFEQNVQVSLTTLDKLKASLKFGDEANQSFKNIESASNNVKMSGLSAAIQNVKMQFSSLDVIAATALGNITNTVLNKTKSILGSAIDSVVGGGIRRAKNLEKAYFMLNGIFKETGKEAEKTKYVMNAVDKAVTGTAFSLDEAAVVASQLAASQIEVTETGGPMLSALQSIAGVAATTGSSFQDIGTIFSTVAGNGRLMGDQLLQLSYRGLNAARTIADFTGTSETEIRDMVSKGQISFDLFAAAMQDAFGDQALKANLTFSGALSNTKSALARIGADVAIPTLERLRKVLLSLKTAIDIVHEVIRPFLDYTNKIIFALSHKAIERINKFNEAFGNVVRTFTKPTSDAEKKLPLGFILNAIENADEGFEKLTKKGQQLVRTFRGVVAAIDSFRLILQMAFNIAMIPFRPLLHVFGKVNSGLLAISANVGDVLVVFRDKLQSASDKLNAKLEKLNDGIVAIIDGFIAWVKEYLKVGAAIKSLFGLTDKGVKSIERFGNVFALSTKNAKTGKKEYTALGNAVHHVKSAFEKVTEPLSIYFSNIKSGMKPAEAFNTLLKDLKNSIDISSIVKSVSDAFAAFGEIINGIFDKITEFFGGDLDPKGELEKFKDTTKDISGNLGGSATAIDSFRIAIDKLGTTIKKNVSGNFGIGEGLAIIFGVGIIAALHKFSKAIGVLTPITSMINKVTGTIGEVKKAISDFRFVMVAKQLTTFTLALTALTLALVQLGSLPVENVKAAGGVIAIIAGVIGAVAVALTLITASSNKGGDVVKKTTKATSVIAQLAGLLLALSFAIISLSVAIKVAGSIDPETLKQGAILVGGALAALSVAIILISKNSERLIMSSKVIWAFAGAMLAMVFAISVLSKVQIDASMIGKLAALAAMIGMMMSVIVLLGALDKLGLKLAGGKEMLGLLALSGSLLVLVVALKILQKLDVSAILKNISELGDLLLAIVGVMILVGLTGKYALRGGAGLLAMSVALGLMVFVIKMASKLKVDEIVYGLVVIKLLSMFFTKIIAVTIFAGKNAAKAGVTLIAFAGAMLILTACIAVLSHISLEGIAKGIIAIDAIGVMMMGLIYITKYAKITKSVSSTILMLAITIGVMTAAIGVLSMIDTGKVMGAVAALTIVMAAFGGLIYATKYLKLDKEVLFNMGILIGVIATLGGVLALLASLPFKNTIAAAGALTGSLLAFAATVQILNTVGKFSAESLKSMGYIVLLVGMMSLFMLALSEIKIDPGTAKALATMGAVMTSMGIIVAILSRVYKSGSAGAVLEGVGVVVAVILGLGAIAAGLGALQKYVPEVEDFINRGAKVFASIGTAIGAIFGGLVNGFLTYSAAGIANMGTQLSAFAENASGFFEAVKGVDPSVAEGAKNMAKAIAYLTGADFLSKVTSFITGKQSFDGFGEQLSSFTDALVAYNTAVGKVTWNTEAITASTDAAMALADVAKAAPAVGGLAQVLSGTQGLNKGFSNQFKTFAKNIIECSDAFEGVTINVDTIRNAATAAKALADLATELPKNVMLKIGEFSLSISSGNLGNFGTNLATFGEALSGFSKKVSGIKDIKGIKMAAQACNALASASTKISSISVIDWSSTSSFSNHAGKFGQGLSDFSTKVSNVDASKIKSAAEATNSLATAMKKASGVSSGDNLAGFKNMASNLGDAISTAASSAVSKTKKLTQKVNIKTDAKIDTSSITKAFSKLDNSAAKSAGTKLANSCKTAMSNVKGWYTVGSNAGQGFVNGVKSKLNSSSAAGRAIAQAAKKAAMAALREHSPSKEMYKVGSFAGEGFVIGLTSWVKDAYKSGLEVANATSSGIGESIKSIYDAIDSEIDSSALSPVITPIVDLSNVQNGFSTIAGMQPLLNTNAALISGYAPSKTIDSTNTDVVKAINKLRGDIDKINNTTYVVDGITYDDGSNITSAVQTLVRATKIEGRV